MKATELLTELTERGIELVVDVDTLRYRPQSRMTPELIGRLKAQKQALLALLAKPAIDKRCEGNDWPAALADFVLLLTPDDLPATPFEFGGRHCVVVDRVKFLSAKQADIRRGPAGPRAMYGAIQGDLRRLRELLFNSEN